MFAGQIKELRSKLSGLGSALATCGSEGSPHPKEPGLEPWGWDVGVMMVGFQLLVITSVFPGKLMFSVTCTFSHCELALVLKKQSDFSLRIFFSAYEECYCWKLQPVCG